VEELESTISELEEALQQQQTEASDVVEQWSARWSELDALKSQLETKLEALTSERDDLAESLQRERENGGREKVDQIERERSIERGEWNAEKEVMQARINNQNESLLVSSQNITELETALENLQEQSAGVVDEWKGKSN
jgi:chromosome segregation ATPase